jgi:hypothetical protein
MDGSNSVPQTVSNSLTRSNAPRPHLPEILSKQFVDRLEKDLQLTLGQRADIERIIADGQDDMRKAVQGVRLDARQKIREKLTDPQKKQFDDLFKQSHPNKKMNSSTNAPSVLSPTNSSPAV